MEKQLLWVTLPDLGYTIFFFFFLIFLKLDSNRHVRHIRQRSTYIEDFTIEVKGFPSIIVHENELKAHFQ